MEHQLRLYVTGETPHALRALRNLKRICEELLAGQYELRVIDVLEDPELAEADRIVATPTLVKLRPPPPNRVIGDLSDREKVLTGLNLVVDDGRHCAALEPGNALKEAE